MQRVANHRFLFRRGAVFYFRRAVPKAARYAFGGKADVTISLQTSSLAEARHALAARLKEFDRVVASARQVPDPTVRRPRVVALRHEPSRDEIDETVREWLRWQQSEFLERDFQERAGEAAFASELRQMQGITAEKMKRRPRDPELATQWIADELARQHGWIVPADGMARSYLMNRVARGQIEWARVAEAEVRFDPHPVPDAIFAPELHRQDRERVAQRARSKPVSIMALFEAYCREASPAPATVKAWNTCLRSLVDHLGHEDATKVTKADIVAWKDALLSPADGSLGRSHNTISKKYLAAAKTVFGWGEQNLKIASNPADKVRIALPTKEQLRAEPGLNDREAKIILAAALSAEPDPASTLRGFGRRWIPWLCAYSGARVGEIRATAGGGCDPARGRPLVHPHHARGGLAEAQAGAGGAAPSALDRARLP